jgi:hypothetical protein
MIKQSDIEKAQKLKRIGRAIAKFPDDRFRSNCLSSKDMRLSYYLQARGFLSGKDIDYHWLPIIIQDANNDLSHLMSGQEIKKVIFL